MIEPRLTADEEAMIAGADKLADNEVETRLAELLERFQRTRPDLIRVEDLRELAAVALILARRRRLWEQ